ncbi:MAG: hypothetical protein AUJ98_09745 [Bacteroidetes bacterium CG2_30_33_31]|nr:MAG: hypothetical protein AUJ98_09745 [Bacteroidetes bacterium CG2_30_33_31]
MKKTNKLKVFFLLFGLLFTISISNLKAQTAGTMTFTFTQTAVNAQATKNVMAIWIEDANGTFVKTRARFWSAGTNDHLPSWVTKSGQNTAPDAITGATLTSSTTMKAFGTKTITWDGKNAAGTLMPDGNYKVIVESSWCKPEPANGSHKFLSTFTFAKGTTASTVTPTDANLTSISVAWAPSSVSIDKTFVNIDLDVFPNPTTGMVNLNFKKAIVLDKINVYSIAGKLVYSEQVKQSISSQKSFDLSNLTDGIYLMEVISTDKTSTIKKIVINR